MAALALVVCARASAKDKPLHESYAKGLEAEKKKVNFHAMRRDFHKAQEEQKEETAPAPAPVSKWAAKPSVRPSCAPSLTCRPSVPEGSVSTHEAYQLVHVSLVH